MGMKMIAMAAVLAATVGIFGVQQAPARGVDYHGKNHQACHKVNDVDKEKLAKFRADIKDIRKQIVMKRAEKSALIKTESPNLEAVKKAAGELFDLRMALHEKAKSTGIFTFEERDIKEGKFAEKHAKMEKFFADTTDLRKQISIAKAEKRALMHSRTPDPLAVSKIAGTLFDLRNSLHEKAIAAGLPGNLHRKGKGRHSTHRCDFMG